MTGPRGGAHVVMVVVALAAGLIACAAPAGAPASHVPTVSATVRDVSLDGQVWRVLVTDEDGMRGLDGFAGADGMLFDMGAELAPDAVAFVMDGVHIPLDTAWFAADGRLVGTSEMAPCVAEPCPRHVAPGPFRWAIEAPPGAFDGLAVDTRLEVAP